MSVSMHSLQVAAWYWPPVLFVAGLSVLVCLYQAYLVVRASACRHHTVM